MTTKTLADEVANDPLVRGYSGMTDQQIADSLNTVDRVVIVNHHSNHVS